MSLDPERRSYLKTLVIAAIALTIIAGLALLALLALPRLSGSWRVLVVSMCGMSGFALAVVVASGLIVLWRDGTVQSGRPDPFLTLNVDRSERGTLGRAPFRAGWLRRWFCSQFLGHDFLAGDAVEVLSFDEISETLDAHGSCGGLPFQAEMLRFCGTQATVFRAVEKIYDYGRTKEMRRLKGAVLLAGMRCDGTMHGGCQAFCYLIWNVAWLRRKAPAELKMSREDAASPHSGRVEWIIRNGRISEDRYSCQYTALCAASTPMAGWIVQMDPLPAVTGNITLRAFLVAKATAIFNRVQAARGGLGFPRVPKSTGPGLPLRQRCRIKAGDLVRVRSPAEIGATLDGKSKNAGLWFDRDMLKHCGTVHVVKARVERIIDDVSGKMIQMKTPSFILEGLYASGEHPNLCAQHDYYFWREAWLEPASHGIGIIKTND